MSLVFVFAVYKVFDRWNDWTAYVDTFTTAIFFVGMWLMARRKLKAGFFGLSETSFQFRFIFTRASQ